VKKWIPHALSLSRVPLAFILVVTYRIDSHGLTQALMLFAVAAITDKLDGVVARNLKVASYSGYLVDGFADRTFSVACVLVATTYHALPLWTALLAIAREITLYTCRLIKPGDWHPPSRVTRLHSLAVFGVTRLWFLGLIIAGLTSPFTSAPVLRVSAVLNGIYSIALVISSLALFDTLLRALAQCFEEER
jgi:CDP-diacylglycerol--glycerol-3-phosphate 3-phosphatidyltransferase